MTIAERVLQRWADSEHKPLKTTQDLLDEMAGIRLRVSRLDHQIKYSTSPSTRNQWIRSRKKLVDEHNRLLADYQKFTGKDITVKRIHRL